MPTKSESPQENSAALAAVMNHFDSLETATIEVPEWGITLFVKPMTLADQRLLFNRTNSGDEVSSALDVLVMLALDQTGKPLFTIEDKPKMMRRAAADVVSRVAGEILAAQSGNAEKN